ncbi:MAG TPA: fused MFS/spermidine synthase [Gammaproteobacteria bacterium]
MTRFETEVRSPPAAFPLLALAFAASGCAALIYEVVWFQLLGFVIGASAVSAGVLLATFMGGLCAGSLLFPRVVSPRAHPLRVYALLELGIGVCGLGVLYALPAIGGVYAAWAESGSAGIALRAGVAAVCLLPPTMLMGATLPAVSRAVGLTPRGVARIGVLYGANLAGAVAGSLLAGFYLLRVHDVAVATLVAAGLNLSIAAGSLLLARAMRRPESIAAGPAGRAAPVGAGASAGGGTRVHVAIALSGMAALSAEVVWTRHLSLVLGATVYAFALILAVFLAALGLGSAAGAALSRRLPASAAFAGCQLLLCAAVAWAGYALARSLPYWPLDVTLPATSAVMLQLDLVRAAFATFPAALLWGASFPLALAAAAPTAPDPARGVGRLYAANTLGGIVGALATSFVLVVAIGSQATQQVLIALSAAAALLVLAPWRDGAMRAGAAALTVAAAAAVLARTVPLLPPQLVAYGRFMPTRAADIDVVYAREGLTASVAVSKEPGGHLTYHAAGKAQASTYPQDMRLQRMLGHLTTLIPEDPESFLVIGLGAGVTAGAVSIDPAAKRVVVAEIEPLARQVAGRYFRAQNFGVVDNPKVEIVVDDGRHFLATTAETFDGITSDPLDPWAKGAASLYTVEFWRLVKARLRPGGVVTVFVQLYETTEEAVRSELATFFEVFPNGAVFANTVQGSGYDAVLVGFAGDPVVDVDRLHARLSRPEYARVARSLEEVGFPTAVDLLATYAGRRSDLAAWLEGAAVNRDRNLRLQYLAADGLNLYRANAIFASMTAGGVEFPEDLFTGSRTRLAPLHSVLRARDGRF